MRYFFRVEYDGTDYGGWQRQENGPSIQQALEEAFSVILRTPVSIVGAGRTDAGVHARRLGAHVDITSAFDIRSIEKSINAILPWSIAIASFSQVPDSFHARYSAQSRRYKYYMSTVKAPLLYKKAWLVYHTVDWPKAIESCACLIGTHDFTTFCATGSSNEDSVCTVSEAGMEREGSQWVFSIAANRFVYKMVRSLVGTVIEIGRGAIQESMKSLIDKKDRSLAGETAPACGLVLDDVRYAEVD
jgi:tRNA pseudouridine38-40 synthase